MNPGILYAALAYTAWGLLPLYFHQLQQLDSFEIVVQRTVWALVFVLGLLVVRRQWAWLGGVVRSPRVLAAFALSALLLSSNWLIYIWAVNHGHVLDASLGYFALPLANVAMGYLFLQERPRPAQWFAVAVAASGVLWLGLQAGHVPWVALALALTFGFYGLLRKLAVLGALEGLALETMLLAPLAVGLLVYGVVQGHSVLVLGDRATIGWLLLAGPLTAIPLLLFAAGARRIPLTTLGLLQYISPTLQLFMGIWLFHEPLPQARLVGFVLIWLALLVYSAEGWWFSRRGASPTAPSSPSNRPAPRQ